MANGSVFVIPGRSRAIQEELSKLLRSIGLEGKIWGCSRLLDRMRPLDRPLLDQAFGGADAILVILSGDFLGKENPGISNSNESNKYSMNWSLQAAPETLLEAGLALGAAPERTILLQVGRLQPMKKVWSREIHLLSNSIKSRFWLIERLKTLGCNVDLSSDSWKTEGDFDVQRSEPVQQEVGVVDSSRRSPVVTLPKISEVEAGFLVKIEEVLRSSFTDSVAPGYIAKIQEADLEEVERLCERLTMLGYLEAHRQIGMVKYSISSAGRQSLREASS